MKQAEKERVVPESEKTKTIRQRAESHYKLYDEGISKNQIKRSKDSIDRWISSHTSDRIPIKDPESKAPMTKRVADFLRKLQVDDSE